MIEHDRWSLMWAVTEDAANAPRTTSRPPAGGHAASTLPRSAGRSENGVDGRKTFDEVLSTRVSARRFSTRPIAAERALKIAGEGLAFVSSQWGAEGAELTAICLLTEGSPLDRGLYAADGKDLRRVGSVRVRDLSEWTPLTAMARASMLLVFGGDMSEVSPERAPGAYSKLLVQVGAAAQAAWLEAIADDLAGCLVGFFHLGPLRRRLDESDLFLRPYLTLALGEPAEGD